MNWPDHRCRIEVSLDRQQVTLFKEEKKIFEAFASTAANGAGFEEGSFQTPTGNFVVRERIGEESGRERNQTTRSSPASSGSTDLTPKIVTPTAATFTSMEPMLKI
jgi:hypothetical protein